MGGGEKSEKTEYRFSQPNTKAYRLSSSGRKLNTGGCKMETYRDSGRQIETRRSGVAMREGLGWGTMREQLPVKKLCINKRQEMQKHT